MSRRHADESGSASDWSPSARVIGRVILASVALISAVFWLDATAEGCGNATCEHRALVPWLIALGLLGAVAAIATAIAGPLFDSARLRAALVRGSIALVIAPWALWTIAVG